MPKQEQQTASPAIERIRRAYTAFNDGFEFNNRIMADHVRGASAPVAVSIELYNRAVDVDLDALAACCGATRDEFMQAILAANFDATYDALVALQAAAADICADMDASRQAVLTRNVETAIAHHSGEAPS